MDDLVATEAQALDALDAYLSATYGADPGRWPADERSAYAALCREWRELALSAGDHVGPPVLRLGL